MTELPFKKMHGLGNDFVVIDARGGKPAAGVAISAAQAAAIADRRTGVGCDQFIIIEDAPDVDSHAFMRIRNADGARSMPAAMPRAASAPYFWTKSTATR